MYFGASFSRYGFDFRPLFIQFFSQTALSNFQNSLHEVNHVFEQLLNSYTFDQYVQLPSSDSSTILTNPFVPPMILVSYTPLAVYCNALLTAFNDLRLCCPLSTVRTVKQLLTDSLTRIRNLLLNYYNSEKVTLTVIESEHFIDFLRVFISIFIPYIDTCMQALFPDTQLARELGVSVLDISEKSKLNRIDIDQIIEPIRNIIESVIPKKTQSPENIPTEVEIIPNEVKEQIPTPKEEEEDQQEKTEDIDNKSDVIE
jgi:hypothetical protein